MKFILSQILCLISFFFWKVPNDNDIVEVMEGTGMCIVLRRDHEAEAAEKASMNEKAIIPYLMEPTPPTLWEGSGNSVRKGT